MSVERDGVAGQNPAGNPSDADLRGRRIAVSGGFDGDTELYALATVTHDDGTSLTFVVDGYECSNSIRRVNALLVTRVRESERGVSPDAPSPAPAAASTEDPK